MVNGWGMVGFECKEMSICRASSRSESDVPILVVNMIIKARRTKGGSELELGKVIKT